MQKKWILLVVTFLLCVLGAEAGTKGILKGKVVDGDKKPLNGAKVSVLGTTLGAITKDKGEFVIANIPAGEYEIKVFYTGLPEQRLNVKINVDASTEIDVVLLEKNVKTNELIVYGEKRVDANKVGIINNIDKNALTGGTANSIDAVVSQTAGVVSSGQGYQIRGARPEDTQIKVDGMDIGNQFSGNYGGGGSAYYPQISNEATEQVQVISGGFGANYGDATGGVVNSVVKTGRTDRYEGFLTFRTDLPSLNGKQASGLKVIRDGKSYKPIQTGEGKKLLGSNENTIDFGFGGPIPELEGSTFYLTGTTFTEKYRNNSYDMIDPLGYNWGQLENQRSWKKNITGRFTYAINSDTKIIFGGAYGISSLELANTNWIYNNDVSTVAGSQNGVQERIAKQGALNQLVTNALLRINHNFSSSSYMEITFSTSRNDDESGKRVGASDPDFLKGFELYKPIDNLTLRTNAATLESEFVEGKDRALDIYQLYTNRKYSEDGLFMDALPDKNPLTGYYEGAATNYGTRNAWGLPAVFINHGNTLGYTSRKGTYFEVNGSYTNVFSTLEFEHTFNSGFEFRTYDQNLHVNSNPYQGDPSYDIYTADNGGNIYAEGQALKDATSKSKTPMRGSLYVQDQITYKKTLVFTPGLRFEYFNPNSDYRSDLSRWVPITDASGFSKATAKVTLSPRINISYPITDKSYISVNYGVYYKMPTLQSMYDGFNTNDLRPGTTVGDPNIEPQRTNQYQVAYSQQITDELSLSISAYYNDIFKQLGYEYVKVVPTPFWRTKVSEYGSNKGIEFDFVKREMGDHVNVRLNYALALVTGTAANATSNVGTVIDPFTDLYAFPLSEYVLDRDIRHRVNFITDFRWGNNEGPVFEDINILENTTLNFTTRYTSGAPYTKVSTGGTAISERNILRGPGFFSADMHISKLFYLRDWFGEDLKNASFEIYLDAYNFLNLSQIVGLYATTDDPNDDGVSLQRQIGYYSDIKYYKQGDIGRAETFQKEQYDTYGQRMYSAQADLDKNGVVTQAELYQQYINYIEFLMQRKTNYQAPRQIYFGMKFRF